MRGYVGGVSRRCASRPVTRTLMTGPKFTLRNIERSSQLLGEVVGQRDLAALHTSHELRGDTGRSAEQRLSQASEYTPVSGEPLIFRNVNDVGDGDADRLDRSREQVHLGRRTALLPASNRLALDPNDPTQLRLRDTGSTSSLLQLFGLKTAHDSSTHRVSPTRKVLIARHCAIPSLRCAHTGSNGTLVHRSSMYRSEVRRREGRGMSARCERSPGCWSSQGTV